MMTVTNFRIVALRYLVVNLCMAGLIVISGLAASLGTGCGSNGTGGNVANPEDITNVGDTTNTNACTVGDDFSADLSECWPLTEISPGGDGSSPWTWESILQSGVLTFNTARGSLDYSTVSDWTGVAMYKEITIDSDTWEIIFKLSTSGIDGIGDYYGEAVSLELYNNYSDWNSIKRITIGISAGFGGDEPTKCVSTYNSIAGQGPQAVVVANCTSDGATYWLKLSAVTGTIVPQVSTDGTNWTTMEVYRDEPFPSPAQIREEMRYLVLSFSSIDNTMSATIDDIILSGVSLAE